MALAAALAVAGQHALAQVIFCLVVLLQRCEAKGARAAWPDTASDMRGLARRGLCSRRGPRPGSPHPRRALTGQMRRRCWWAGSGARSAVQPSAWHAGALRPPRVVAAITAGCCCRCAGAAGAASRRGAARGAGPRSAALAPLPDMPHLPAPPSRDRGECAAPARAAGCGTHQGGCEWAGGRQAGGGRWPRARHGSHALARPCDSRLATRPIVWPSLCTRSGRAPQATNRSAPAEDNSPFCCSQGQESSFRTVSVVLQRVQSALRAILLATARAWAPREQVQPRGSFWTRYELMDSVGTGHVRRTRRYKAAQGHGRWVMGTGAGDSLAPGRRLRLCEDPRQLCV